MDDESIYAIPCSTVECPHKNYTKAPHCFYVDCPNYLMKCPRHYRVPFDQPDHY